MGKLNLTGEDVKIIRKDGTSKAGKAYTLYSMMISSKDMDNNWVNGFINCRFKKGIEVNNKAKILIKSAFPTVAKWGDRAEVTWMILDFEVVDAGEVPVSGTDFIDMPADGEDTELPFL